ncbi:hypothetical protein LTR05_001327 [Lithohypha guttulata]|uniref:SCP domain-containing protein n=1 Tax=Lithohypha guttulata TaxID=1690604 RepID=A0AAN7T7D7_9EURO|nr:hypothetical protein LTR05_001327 [Lithohypha guttulata]
MAPKAAETAIKPVTAMLAGSTTVTVSNTRKLAATTLTSSTESIAKPPSQSHEYEPSMLSSAKIDIMDMTIVKIQRRWQVVVLITVSHFFKETQNPYKVEMHIAQALSVLALAGSTLAVPFGPGMGGGDNNRGGDKNRGSGVSTEWVIATATTYVFANGGSPTQIPALSSAPAVTVTSTQPAVTYPPFSKSQAPSAAPSSKSQAPAAPSAAPSTPSTGSSDGTYMGVISKWRSQMGLSALSHDSKLEGNALKTAQDGNGNMVHELNPGTMGQVLAPGDAGDFEKVFVGGWLCERPELSGLNGICTTMSQGWAYNGQTGHADILVDSKYSKIGCGVAGGIWACDVA